METVGTCLKNEREANNISLKEVARITKITGIYLEHIEKDEFDKLPQGPYIKAYLSSYSRAIGCDVDKVIDLYESANREEIRSEDNQPQKTSMDRGKNSADKPTTKIRKPPGSLRLSNLRSWFNPLTALLTAKGSPIKVAQKPTDATDSSKPNIRKPFRHRDGRVKQSSLSVSLRSRPTNRRLWMNACIALIGAFAVFFAAVGLNHLYIHNPDTVTVAEYEKIQDKEKSLSSSMGSRPSIGPTPSTDAYSSVDAPKLHVRNNRLSEPAKSDPAVSGAKSETDIPPGTSESLTQTGVPYSESSSAAQQSPLLSNNAEVRNTGPTDRQPIKSDPSPKPTIANESLRVLEATICRAIENRMPADIDRPFHTSDEKIFVWNNIEAKQVPSKIRHIYYFGGKKISDISLSVGSTHWRTWSSKKIANRNYRGEWRVDIATSNGEVLRRLSFEIK